MAHFTALVQVFEGFSDLIGIHQRVRTVDQQQIQMVGRQVSQRLFRAFHNMIAVSDVVAKRVFRAGGGGDTAFSDDLHALAQMRSQFQRLAKGGFAQITTVNIRMVHGGDT